MARIHLALLVCVALLSVLLQSCGPGSPLATVVSGRSWGHDTFGYRKWINKKHTQDVVIIGIHGFCGDSVDYKNLGEYLYKNQPETGLYAYNVRGQGSDPITARRGDIGDPQDWYSDLLAFTGLVRGRHPHAKIVWFGESMGSLIAAHALQQAPPGSPPIDGLVLSSPIVRFRDDIPAWAPGLVQVAATSLPLARVSLATISQGQDVQMTQTSHHNEQVKKNSYNIENHTLRLLGTLTKLIDGMNACAASTRVPILVLHGGQDYFNNDADLRGFVARIPKATSTTYHNYPAAYHLLMYDAKRELIFADIATWTNELRER